MISRSMATLENEARPPNKLGSGLVASSSRGTIDAVKVLHVEAQVVLRVAVACMDEVLREGDSLVALQKTSR